MVSNVCALVLCLFVTSSLAKKVAFTNCGPEGSIQSLDISACNESPCKLKKGLAVDIAQSFSTSGSPVTAITAAAYGSKDGMVIQQQLPQKNACSGSNLDCPLQAGHHVYKTHIVIPDYAPETSMDIMWDLRDQDGQVLTCFKVPVEVVG